MERLSRWEVDGDGGLRRNQESSDGVVKYGRGWIWYGVVGGYGNVARVFVLKKVHQTNLETQNMGR